MGGIEAVEYLQVPSVGHTTFLAGFCVSTDVSERRVVVVVLVLQTNLNRQTRHSAHGDKYRRTGRTRFSLKTQPVIRFFPLLSCFMASYEQFKCIGFCLGSILCYLVNANAEIKLVFLLYVA